MTNRKMHLRNPSTRVEGASEPYGSFLKGLATERILATEEPTGLIWTVNVRLERNLSHNKLRSID